MATSSVMTPAPDKGRAASWLADLEDAIEALTPVLATAMVLMAAAAFGLVYALLNPGTLRALLDSLAGTQPKVFWYLSRASAFVAFGLLWMSMVLGLAITNRLARLWPGGLTYTALHEHTSVLGLAFGVVHALFLLGDRYIGYTLPQLLLPFGNLDYRPAWVALGQAGLYLLIPVTLSFYLRRSLGPKMWRLVHAFSYAAFGLTLLHGLLAGTDSTAIGVLFFYWASFVSVAGLTAYRVLAGLAGQIDAARAEPAR